MRVFLLIVAIAVFGPGDGKKKGRRANAMYLNDQYMEAASLYRDGILDVQEGGPGSVHAGLLNNLGASLFRQGEYEQAASAFAGSSRMSGSMLDAVRANYNTGNALAMQQELETALDYYRSALLEDPDNEDAKFNYEFVKRQLEQQQQQQQQQDQDSDSQENQDQQEQDQQNQEQQDNPDQNEQQQQEQQPDNQDPNQQEQQQNPDELSEQEAERILQALENEEEQLLRQIQKMKTRPRRVEKDW